MHSSIALITSLLDVIYIINPTINQIYCLTVILELLYNLNPASTAHDILGVSGKMVHLPDEQGKWKTNKLHVRTRFIYYWNFIPLHYTTNPSDDYIYIHLI